MSSTTPSGDAAPIQIVDEDDKPLGVASMDEARQKGLLHRIVRVMVRDKEGRLLLQRRGKTQRTYPDCWDCSAAGHVDGDETYEQAAYRELEEEIGLKGFTLLEVTYYRTNQIYNGLKLNRFNKLYELTVPSDTHFVIQPEEVTGVQWFSLPEVLELIKTHPDQVSDGLIQAIERRYRS